MRRIRQDLIYYTAAIVVTLFIVCVLRDILSERRDAERQREYPKGQESEESRDMQGETPADNPDIRVLLLSSGYLEPVHPEVVVSAPGGLFVESEGEKEEWDSDESLSILPDDDRFSGGNIRVRPMRTDAEISVSSIERACGVPSYAGVLDLYRTAEGIAIVNELPLEDYLCKVVPSEMPASYEMEALKAQAVCARSYAYRQTAGYAYPEYQAHVNDSTDFQVYNNSGLQEKAAQAVRETGGQVIRYRGNVAAAYYFSTSCGRTTDMGAWGTPQREENQYLQSISVAEEEGDYEKDLPWYRWTATVPVELMSNLFGLNTGNDVGTLQSLEVTKRGAGDVALQITAVGEKGSAVLETENKIRSALGGEGYTILKNDGTEVESSRLLPSAFFTIERSGENFVIRGGGYGHGVGMSQNGANEMAKRGKTYLEILHSFFCGVTVE